MENDIKVSVICNAYNHEKFIRDALEGFVMQKTSFKFEILVHDDASTDGTADIIREYEKKYPELIKPIYQTENQYSKDGGRVGRIQRERAKGKYFAPCEGDDYWTDPLKLQKQYDALEAHPECDMCAHAAVMVREYSKQEMGIVSPSDKDTILTPDQVIIGGGGYLVTCALMYRAAMYDNESEFGRKATIDYAIQILGSLRGGIVYLSDRMSAYRIRQSNSWTSETLRDKNKRIAFWDKSIELRAILNKETNYKYDAAIRKADINANIMIMRIRGDLKGLKKEPYKSVYDSYPMKKKLMINIEQYCPILIKLRNRIRGKV